MYNKKKKRKKIIKYSSKVLFLFFISFNIPNCRINEIKMLKIFRLASILYRFWPRSQIKKKKKKSLENNKKAKLSLDIKDKWNIIERVGRSLGTKSRNKDGRATGRLHNRRKWLRN